MMMGMARVCCCRQVAGDDNYNSRRHKEKHDSDGGSGGWQWRRRVDQLQISGHLLVPKEIKKKKKQRRTRCGDRRLVGDDGPASHAWLGGKNKQTLRNDGGLVVLL